MGGLLSVLPLSVSSYMIDSTKTNFLYFPFYVLLKYFVNSSTSEFFFFFGKSVLQIRIS